MATAPVATTKANATRMVSVIVPTYGEVDNLRPLVTRISDALASSPHSFEIIVVDDDSRDGSDEQVALLAKEEYPVRIITRTGERGLSSAVIRGFSEAKGNVFVCMDADLSHPPEALPELVACLDDATVDFAVGSRFVSGASIDKNWGLFRWMNSAVSRAMARPFVRMSDPMSGFFALRQEAFKDAEALLNPVGYKIAIELIVKAGCRNIREIPIHFADRTRGESKLSLREQLNYIRHLKRLADFKYGEWSHFAQFCFIGATGSVVDLGCFALLRHLDWSLMVCAAVAIWIAMTWNFFLNRRLTFSYSRDDSMLRQYGAFVATCSLGGVVNWSIRVALVTYVALFMDHELCAAACGIIAGTFSNYSLSRHWVFKKNKND